MNLNIFVALRHLLSETFLIVNQYVYLCALLSISYILTWRTNESLLLFKWRVAGTLLLQRKDKFDYDFILIMLKILILLHQLMILPLCSLNCRFLTSLILPSVRYACSLKSIVKILISNWHFLLLKLKT